MLLTQCKICNSHICVLKDKVLCGFEIDRLELQIKSESSSEKIVDGCPKENEAKKQKLKKPIA